MYPPTQLLGTKNLTFIFKGVARRLALFFCFLEVGSLHGGHNNKPPNNPSWVCSRRNKLCRYQHVLFLVLFVLLQ